MKSTLAEKRAHEDALLMEVFLSDCTNEEEIQNGYLNYELVKYCLVIMKMKSLMIRKVGQRRDIDTLIEASIKQRIELGIMPKTKVALQDIKSATYNFSIKYKKAKGVGGKKRIHIDTRVFVADTDSTAINLLRMHLVKLKEEFMEVLVISKKLHSVQTKSKGTLYAYSIEIFDDRKTTTF